jgi:hypothetical protein
MPAPTDQFKSGQRVLVTQQIPQRDDNWSIRVEGSVVGYEQRKTGSWYAHAKDDRLWLDRLVLRKDDGEIVVCNLDRYTRVEELAPAPATGSAAGADASANAGRPIDYNKDHVQPPSGYQSLELDGGDSSAGQR